MTTISPIIDSDKIVEILFENAEEIPNNIYINIMSMMQRYHEHGDNEREIRNYLKIIDPQILNKFDRFIAKQPCCVINISCDYCVNRFNVGVVVVLIFGSALTTLIYYIYKTSRHKQT